MDENYNIHTYFPIITTRKRSCGEGNVFTGVCHSVDGGGLHSAR